MKLAIKGSNQTTLSFNGTEVLFSYETPVAGYDDQGAFRTEEKFSVTTSKHINKYLGGKDVGRIVPQSYIEGLMSQRIWTGCRQKKVDSPVQMLYNEMSKLTLTKAN